MQHTTVSGDYVGRHRVADSGNVRGDRNPFYKPRHAAEDKSC
jgi:hypothetical protein